MEVEGRGRLQDDGDVGVGGMNVSRVYGSELGLGNGFELNELTWQIRVGLPWRQEPRSS